MHSFYFGKKTYWKTYQLNSFTTYDVILLYILYCNTYISKDVSMGGKAWNIMLFLLNIKFKQSWSTAPSISTKRTNKSLVTIKKIDIIVSMNNPGPTLGRALNVAWLDWWMCFQPPLLIIWSQWLYISDFLAHCNTDYWPFNKLLVEINWTANKWVVKSHYTKYTVHLP